VRDARTEADAAAQAVADASRSAQALVELSVGQLKENVDRIERDVREARNQHAELSTAHSGAISRLDASGEAAKEEALRGFSALNERVGRSEELGWALKGELDETIRHEHGGLMAWAEEARGQISGLRGDVDAARSIADEGAARGVALADDARQTAATLEEVGAEGRRHLSAIRLLVESVDKSSAESRENAEALGRRFGGLEQQVKEARAAHTNLAASCEAEQGRLREATRQLEDTCSSLREEATASKLSVGRQSERLKSAESDIGGLRRDGAEAAAGARALKVGLKDCVDKQKQGEQKVRKTLDQLDVRCEAYDQAFSSFADSLKLANPLHASFGS